MNTYRNPTSRLFVMVTILALLVVALMACGPADESVQQELGNEQIVAQQGDPTPEPTEEPTAEPECPYTKGNYPLLDEALQDMVRKYETCELTEAEAAALAPEHHENSVLVQTNVTANIGTLDDWMGEQDLKPRFAIRQDAQPHIFAFVQVSLLGALSQRDGVSAVMALASPFDEGVEIEVIRDPNAAKYSDDEPELPVWLKGVPYPGIYPTMREDLRRLIVMYDAGELTDAVKTGDAYGCAFRDDNMLITAYVNDDAAATRVKSWLAQKGVDMSLGRVGFSSARRTPMLSYLVPVSAVGDLSKQPGVYRVATKSCGYVRPWGQQSTDPIQGDRQLDAPSPNGR